MSFLMWHEKLLTVDSAEASKAFDQVQRTLSSISGARDSLSRSFSSFLSFTQRV